MGTLVLPGWSFVGLHRAPNLVATMMTISVMDRHEDWCVIVCLVGGGQEINTGEAGVSEWIAALLRSFPNWEVHLSTKLHGSEYRASARWGRRSRP